MSTLMALVWGAILICQGADGPCNSADWDLMSEVGRKLALGKTLYVDAIDQKGPLCYATYALEWLLMRMQYPAYVFSNVAVWAMVTATSVIAAFIVEEARKPWLHLIVQALLAGVIFCPHVGCVEEWLAPLGMLGALWVRRLADGRHVSDVCWIALGVFAAYAFWTKFTCCAQFVFLLCYAASRKNTKGLARACVLALTSCIVASGIVVIWLLLAGSFDGMMQHYIHAATDGYTERMSMFKYMAGDNPSTTHMTSFFAGLPIALWSVAMCIRGSRNRTMGLLVFAAGCFYLTCCFATFVGYYRMQLSTLAVLGACGMTGKPWKLPVISWIDAHIRWRRILWVASIVGIAAATIATTDGVESSIKEAQDKCETLHEAVGESDSVLVWQFDNTWAYGELGLDYCYPIPARYNASQDYWDETAGADLEAGHWEYVIVAAAADVDVDDNVLLNDKGYHVIALSHGMAVAEGGGSGEDLYHNPPYQLP